MAIRMPPATLDRSQRGALGNIRTGMGGFPLREATFIPRPGSKYN